MRELGTGEMAPQLRALAALPEGPSSSPRTLDKLLTTTCNSGFRRRYLWPLRSPVLTYTYSHADTHTYNLKIITNQPLRGKLMSPVHISSCGSIRNGCCPKRITSKGKMIPEGDRRPLKKKLSTWNQERNERNTSGAC